MAGDSGSGVTSPAGSVPRRVVVAGDWHGSTAWAVNVIALAAKALAGEEQPVILSLGDFGLWPGPAGQAYIDAVSRACAEHGAQVWFVDGNHEDHHQLRELHEDDPGPVPVDGAGRIWHLPRGHRWTWHGRTWLALGGAASVDRAVRTEGRDWWPEEEITEAEAAMVIAGGPADVLLSHDCPAGVRHSFPPPPSFWDARDLARSDRHRERLQSVVDAVQPRWVQHGHLHLHYFREAHFKYGPCEVTGFNRDGSPGNYAILDVEHMKWI